MNTLLTTLIIVVSLATGDEPIQPPATWQNPASWRNVRQGMTQEQIKHCLGEPVETESTKKTELWYYSETPTIAENGKVQRPDYGILVFRIMPAGRFLYKWAEPNWQTMLTWQQLQAAYKQALADQRDAEIAEQSRIAAEKRAREAEEQKKQLEAQKQQMAEAAQRENNTSLQEQKKPSRSGQIGGWLKDNILIITVVVVFVVIGAVFVYKK